MNGTFILRRITAALLALLLAASTNAPAFAAQQDIDILKSYIGEWRGRGTMQTSGDPETVVCKLTITSSSATKVIYNGRCTLAGANLSINGTMAYIENLNRFEAVMSSNTSFTGIAVGKRRGKTIDFTLKEKDPDTGSDIAIAVGFELKNDKIQVDFTITDISSGNQNRASVPFEKT